MQTRWYGKKISEDNVAELINSLPVDSDSLDMRFSTLKPSVLEMLLISPRILALKELAMPYCHLNNDNVAALVAYIRQNTLLRKINMRQNDIKGAGAILIKEALVKHIVTNCSLSVPGVRLDDNYENEINRQVSEEQLQIIKILLEKNPLILDIEKIVSEYLNSSELFITERKKLTCASSSS